MFETLSLGLEEAARARDAIFAALMSADNPGALSITDVNGVEVLCARQDGAPARMLGRARAKAYTAARLGMDTGGVRARQRREGEQPYAQRLGRSETDHAAGRAGGSRQRQGDRGNRHERERDDTGRGACAHRARRYGGALMAAYLIADVEVLDQEAYAAYGAQVPSTLSRSVWRALPGARGRERDAGRRLAAASHGGAGVPGYGYAEALVRLRGVRGDQGHQAARCVGFRDGGRGGVGGLTLILTFSPQGRRDLQGAGMRGSRLPNLLPSREKGPDGGRAARFPPARERRG